MSTAGHDVRFYALVGLFAFLSVSLIPNSANGKLLFNWGLLANSRLEISLKILLPNIFAFTNNRCISDSKRCHLVFLIGGYICGKTNKDVRLNSFK